MSERTWQAAPTMLEEYFAKDSIFLQKEDIVREELTTGATDKVWLQFTTNWKWPGPEVKLEGGPCEVKPRHGLRAIPFDSTKVAIEKAFEIAWKRLMETDGGDKFAGTITLYWPMSMPQTAKEPWYTFTTNIHNVIHVGAFTGEVSGP